MNVKVSLVVQQYRNNPVSYCTINQLYMKKLTFLFSVLVFTGIAKAQIAKGSVLLGGSIGASKYKTEEGSMEQKQRYLVISPSAGIAVKDNLVAGLRLFYGHGENKYNNTFPKQESDAYGIGLFLRRYLTLGKNFYLYGEADAGYSRNKSDEHSGTDSRRIMKTSAVGLDLTPGVAYAVSKGFHLEATINSLASLTYSKSKTENISIAGSSKSETTGVSFGTNFSVTAPLSIGFRFVLAK